MGFDKVWWDWYCSLFPSKEHKKINPKKRHCECGYTWEFNKIQTLILFLKGTRIITCPQCQRRIKFKFVYHIVNERLTIDENKINKELEENRKRIWEK